MRQVCLFISLLMSFSYSVSAQNYGNAPFLKYGLSQNDLSLDILYHGFNLTSSPSKSFLLRNLSSEAFSIGTEFQPITDNGKGESSGSSLNIKNPRMPRGYGIGYAFTTHKRQQGHVTWNKEIKLKGKSKKIQFNGYSIASTQDISDIRGITSWERQNKNINGYARLTNANYAAKNKLTFEGYLLLNTADVQYQFENPLSRPGYSDKGQLQMMRVHWKRKMSLNHSLHSEVSFEKFNNNLWHYVHPFQNVLQPTNLRYSRINFRIEDEIKRKKNNIKNVLEVTENRQQLSHREELQTANYSIGLWKTNVTHFLKPNSTGVKYHQGLGVHSDEGMIFNPGIKLFHSAKKLKFDLGANQSSRTPALATEFGTFYNGNNENQVTTKQENVTRLFATTEFKISTILSLEFKFLQTSSNDKWLFDPTQNKLTPQSIKYTSFYGKLARRNYERSSYMFFYRYTTPESSSAEILAQHYASGNYEYHLNRRAVKILNRYKYYDLYLDVKAAYLSKHKLPFMDGTQQALHKGGFFADAHVKLWLGKRYNYYYDYDYGSERLNNVVIRIGVNNLLNTSSTIQPLSANDFKPVLPRQLFTSVTLDF